MQDVYPLKCSLSAFISPHIFELAATSRTSFPNFEWAVRRDSIHFPLYLCFSRQHQWHFLVNFGSWLVKTGRAGYKTGRFDLMPLGYLSCVLHTLLHPLFGHLGERLVVEHQGPIWTTQGGTAEKWAVFLPFNRGIAPSNHPLLVSIKLVFRTRIKWWPFHRNLDWQWRLSFQEIKQGGEWIEALILSKLTNNTTLFLSNCCYCR